jgi:hypothetical protein
MGKKIANWTEVKSIFLGVNIREIKNMYQVAEKRIKDQKK